MRHFILVPLLLFAVFYMVEYEGYNWNPCSDGRCLSIYCGPTGLCHVSGETKIFLNQSQVKELIEQRGVVHLKDIYQVEWPDNDPSKVVIKKLKLVPSFEIKQE